MTRSSRSGALLCLMAVFSTLAVAREVAEGVRGPQAQRFSNQGQALAAPGASTGETVRAFVSARFGPAVAGSLVSAGENRQPRLTHLRYAQQFEGLTVYGSYVKAAFNARGELIGLIADLAPTPSGLVRARINETQALAAALHRHYPGQQPNSSLFAESPRVSRVAVAMTNGTLAESFLVETWDRNNILRHTVIGPQGQVLAHELRTNTDSYKIFPDHPGNSAQTVVAGPGTGNTESPIGWVSNDRTIGNNVDAYLDRDNSNTADANGRPVSASKDFIFTADLTQSPTTSVNQMAAVTNLFYLNNVIHDKLYKHGFNEAAGNFQANNFGKGGAGNDPVNAEAQDGGGTNNANFATPADGSRPRMQMYLWTQSTPSRDGDLDSDIVWHEYGHGLTWRMIGSMGGGLAGAIGEGMSDTLAIYINRNDRVGEYSFNNPVGIRRFPYMNYPLTYGDARGRSVHDDGEIYAATMWKLLELWEGAGLTQELLFDRVVGGMNHTPSNPEFEEMRDGIIAEINAVSSDAQAERCIVWQAFAQFGIGQNAVGSDSCGFFSCRVTVTEDFTVPSECSGGGGGNTAPQVAINSPANGSSFSTADSISFAGTATDNESGDLSSSMLWTSNLDGAIGSGASFSRSLSAGSHTITASATDPGSLSGSASVNITVVQASGGISLTATARKVKGIQHADLSWSGATSSNVDVYRDGALIATTVNDGAHTDNINRKGGGSYVYRVCEAGTNTCSNNATVTF